MGSHINIPQGWIIISNLICISGSSLEVEGSLGGLQVLDLTSEGQTHQRILSLGDDPLAETSKSSYILACLSAEMYNMAGHERIRLAQNQAFSFNVKRESVTPDTGKLLETVLRIDQPNIHGLQ